MLTQYDVELRMYNGGIDRAVGMMTKAEDKGRAVQNPYAKELLGDYVLPLAEAIRAELATSRPGRQHAHRALLEPLDPEAVAFLAVRATINALVSGKDGKDGTVRALGRRIGTAVHHELVLSQIELDNPELYHTLARDLDRRQSKDERHRMTVFKMQAAKAGVKVTEWPSGGRVQVGLYLLELLEVSGMVEIEPLRVERGKYAPQGVALAPDILERIDQVKAFVAVTMPLYGPCVEPPRDWVTPNDGGFHSRELRRTHPTLVRHRLARTALYREAQMPTVLAAANALQRTAWRVNAQMLDIMLKIAETGTVGEITSLSSSPKPAQPAWMEAGLPKEVWTAEQALEFKAWKRQAAEWYTERKLMGIKYGRFYTATRSAMFYRDCEAVYFVHFADSRGRLYPMTLGINPQGSDMQKALITFSEGMPVDTPDAIRWFHVQGANKWGFDKATLEERHKWVIERQDLILSFAEDPINNTGWQEAGSPLQFLAWCLEYREWVLDQTGTFLSRLPISMDGSCNGLQNLSALLRDEIGGRATNLSANLVMEDIYRRVAEAATLRLQQMQYEDAGKESVRQRWLSAGIGRGVVKRSVMTTPYGVTKRSAIDYVIEDTLKRGEYPCFEKTEWMMAATVLMDAAWPAIGDVVVKGRECMEWLRKSARIILRSLDPEAEPIIHWVSPSGFVAAQAYFEEKVHRINTRLAGGTKIRMMSETDDPDKSRHASGLAPNFVHSMDAAHLHLTSEAAAAAGITSLAMIHDDYGTHAAKSQQLFEVIRQQFVRMYEENDPIQSFKDRYEAIDSPPTKGTLDIREVLSSSFFFS